MRLGLHIPNFTWPDGPAAIGTNLAKIAKTADDVGFDRVSVMDHVWQIEMIGPPDLDMLEAYTTLGFLAGQTSRVKLMTLVTGAVYRQPGLLAKIVSTLDVLSGGRAWLGIGAAWNEAEARGLGLSFPPTAERFERLEETLQICLQMWSGNDAPYEGKYYHLERTLNRPMPLTKPHPPILIGGSGEKKTLRLVAKYADACNLFAGPDLAHKLDVLREHCEREGRNFDDIEKTVVWRFDVGQRGEHVKDTIDQLRTLASIGIEVAHGSILSNDPLPQVEIIGKQVLPEIADL